MADVAGNLPFYNCDGDGADLVKNLLGGTRWAPTSCKWSYNLYKWPYKLVTGVIALLIGVITPGITDRGPPCKLVVKLRTIRVAF